LFCLVVSHVFAVDSDEAQDTVSRAESRMSLAYKHVLEAEKTGADVLSLLSRLNDGSALLSEARMQYRIGNFSGAVYLANQCFDSLTGIETEANDLRDGAVMARKQRLLISALGSSFAIGAVFYAGIFGWRFFKNWYYKRALKMWPEVQAIDSG